MTEHSAGKDVPWEPTRWWRVTASDGSIWCETSSESEARDAVRPGDTLSRLFQRTEHEWRPTPPASGDTP